MTCGTRLAVEFVLEQLAAGQSSPGGSLVRPSVTTPRGFLVRRRFGDGLMDLREDRQEQPAKVSLSELFGTAPVRDGDLNGPLWCGCWARTNLLPPGPLHAIYLHQPGALRYSLIMGTRKKAVASTRSVRQSVTMPAALAAEVQLVAKERHVTISRALVALAERGVRAEAEAKAQLKASYHRFIDEKDPAVKNEAGLELMRSIFGKNSIAED